LPGTALIGNCATGPFLFIEYRLWRSHERLLQTIILTSGNSKRQIPKGNAASATGLTIKLLQKHS
jgi:hypothetical protein